MMQTIWHSGFYYDEEQDLTYINTDRLSDDDRLQLIHILGFELVDDEETGDYVLEEVRYGEGYVFDETFKSLTEAFDRLNAYFDDTIYCFVTDQSYPEIWEENNDSLAEDAQ